MKLLENKLQLWFKVLSAAGTSTCQEQIKWSLPKGRKDGDWVQASSEIGILLVSDPKGFYCGDRRIFVAEFKGAPIIERPGVIWVSQVKLVREATNLDLKPLGIYRAFNFSAN